MADGDVLKIVGGHQTFGAPSGGGVTVTGSQGGSVAAATAIKVAGVATDLGDGVAGQGLTLQLVGPFDIAYNTSGLNNPSDLGAEILTVPAGSVFRVICSVTTLWDQPGELIGSVATTSNGTFASLFDYNPQEQSNNHTDVLKDGFPTVLDPTNNGTVKNISAWCVAVNEVKVYIGFYPNDQNPGAGAAKVYALIAAPAS